MSHDAIEMISAVVFMSYGAVKKSRQLFLRCMRSTCIGGLVMSYDAIVMIYAVAFMSYGAVKK